MNKIAFLIVTFFVITSCSLKDDDCYYEIYSPVTAVSGPETTSVNTNVQIHDISQVYYPTLDGSKSTQKEDSERVQYILHAIMGRLSKIKEDIMLGKSSTLNASMRCRAKT